MQYEAIILELLSRIKKLEDDVNELKQARNPIPAIPASDEGSDSRRERETATSYNKITDEMIEICYQYGKKAVAGESVPKLADDIVETTGMNRNSAIMTLYAVQGMLTGTIYKRGISARAIKKYFDAIHREYGSAGLQKAISATRQNITYRKQCGLPADSVEEICDIYEKKL